jgi:two-component system alkaline phosphatase synthesis response regulator PhoP
MANTKILIVDDEPDILEFLQYNLEKEGYEVFVADNGATGLEEAKRILPELIILDIMMPEMDGVEVCRRLRSDSQFDNTIITFLTARQEDYSQIAALEQGGDDYISKPIKPRILVARINAMLRRRQASGSAMGNMIEVDDMRIDLEGMTIDKSGSRIELPRKEFELLQLLLSKPGKVFSRDEIYRKVWGSDVIVGNRTIDVHIRKLREKLGDHYIKTVKGIGYKFDF